MCVEKEREITVVARESLIYFGRTALFRVQRILRRSS